MKYGVLWRKTTKNIGDDVQSFAASLWLPRVDYLVDIEELDSFKAEEDEPVATLMSAWYMWQKWNWPPSKYLYPLWIGFHYNDIQRGRPRGMPSKWEYLTGPGYDYLKAYEPIGCRDYYTQARLEERGIKNYYSGCITLTLPKQDIPKPEKEYVCIVGIEKEAQKYIQRFYEERGIEAKVIRPTRPEPSTNLSWEERKAEVKALLAIYQNAKAVYTFRLHCALPTLALETPVLLIRPSFNSVRFTPYKDYLHTASPQEIVRGKFDAWLESPPGNPDTYKPVRENLIKLITEFIHTAERETRKASELIRTDYTVQEVLEWQNKTMKKTLHSYHIESHIDLAEINSLKKQLAFYKALGEPQELKQITQYGSVADISASLRRYGKLTSFLPIKFFLKIRGLLKG